MRFAFVPQDRREIVVSRKLKHAPYQLFLLIAVKFRHITVKYRHFIVTISSNAGQIMSNERQMAFVNDNIGYGYPL